MAQRYRGPEGVRNDYLLCGRAVEASEKGVIEMEHRLEEYLASLTGVGYTQGTILDIRRKVGSFVQMFPDEKDWNDKHVREFLETKRQKFRKTKARDLKASYVYMLSGAIKRFLRFWGKEALAETPSELSPSWWQMQLQSYLDFCSHHQGLGEATIWRRRYFLKRFIEWLEGHSVRNPEAMRPCLIMGFFKEGAHGYSRSKLKALNAALRGFLRYLYQKGSIARDYSCFVIGPRLYREQHIPSYLTDSQLRTVIEAMDTNTPQGFRDYGIFILLIQYGLRIKEAAELRLDDINWKEHTMLIRNRKAQPHLLLPLTQEAAAVLKGYIGSFRPGSDHAEVFLSLRAPIRPLSAKYLTNMVRSRFINVGIDGHAHLIRHTFAKRLIEQGESLPVIQKLLGHQSLATTRIYAKLAIEQLREVAENDSMDMVG